MPKEMKTAGELAAMVVARINRGPLYIHVHKDPQYGWHPNVMCDPAQLIELQSLAEWPQLSFVKLTA